MGIDTYNPTVRARLANASKTRVLSLKESALHRVPDDVKDLHMLKHLDISINYLTELPPYFGSFNHLKQLNLARNQLESLPVELTLLPCLEILNISQNRLSDVPDLSKCAQLKTIEAIQNQFVEFPLGICKCPALETVTLAENQIERLPDEIHSLRAISVILNKNRIVSLNTANLLRCERLRAVNVDDNLLNRDEIDQFVTNATREVRVSFNNNVSHRHTTDLQTVIKKKRLKFTTDEDMNIWRFAMEKSRKHGEDGHWCDFIDQSGSTRSERVLSARLRNYLLPLLPKTNFHPETKLKLLAEYKVHINEEFLKALQKYAIIKHDHKGIVTAYTMKPFAPPNVDSKLDDVEFHKLMVPTARNYAKFTEAEDAEIWNYLIKHYRRYSIGSSVFWNNLIREKQWTRKARVLIYRFNKILAPQLHKTDFDMKIKLKLYKSCEIPVDQEYLKTLKEHYDLEVDKRGCVCEYEKIDDADIRSSSKRELESRRTASDESDENEIQEIQTSVSTPKVSPNRPVIKTSEMHEDDNLAVEFVRLALTPNRDLLNDELFQNEFIYLNEDDDAASSVNLEEELRIRGGHREQTKEERFDSVRKDLENRGISLRPKPSKKREEFMPLPDSADLLIENAWNRALKQDEIFLEAFSIQICRKDLGTLSGLNLLNDNVINYYLQLICQRSADDSKYPKVYAFNTFFYTNVVSKEYASVKRWTRKVDIFAYDILLIPVHLGMHWCMAVVDFEKKRIEFYDSLYNGNTKVLLALKGYLAAESMDKKKVAFNFVLWTMEQMEDIPRQMNGSDCGVFSCQFGEWASRRKAPEFSQKHMPYYRKRMVHEIVTKHLMATI